MNYHRGSLRYDVSVREVATSNDTARILRDVWQCTSIRADEDELNFGQYLSREPMKHSLIMYYCSQLSSS
jgi:hypothetical protein